ncbi:MAG: adenylosuccinate lyase [Bacteroidota bacterium]|nr:adenylosuccinate lyase [Bacteroidota bacterium]MDP3147298.1 adenylosuccinate lyase [Bacteroidota bacterium]MDP3557328.1 adenylosuccinate lyase [Bacteroidota bacterium]
MELSALTAISPIDGRYRKTTEPLAIYFSEFGLIKYRVLVEIEYFISLTEFGLTQLPELDVAKKIALKDVYLNFSIADAQKIKDTEKITNHDVKAVEYFIKDKLNELGINEYSEFVHFGLTSQDINNTSIPLSLKEATINQLYPALNSVIDKIIELSKEWKDVSLLAKTHGQPASPTKLGKEMYVFVERLNVQLNQLKNIPFSAKFGGATGNFNAHQIAYPSKNWIEFGNHFVNKILGLNRSQFTTQIEHYDNIGAYCDALKRINTILLDFSRDVWTYVSMEYFKQKLKEGEIGSSAMPHKVNPIDFENAEGNLGIANALLEHFSAKLPISRLQRDLTDSTVLRNLGNPLAHSIISYSSILKGLNKLILNEKALMHDLENNWAVVAEAIQTVLRREGYPKPYEALKDLTRTNTHITQNSLIEFINGLTISEEIKKELKQITPHNYTGIHPTF